MLGKTLSREEGSPVGTPGPEVTRMLGTDLRARHAVRDGVSQTVLRSERRVVFSRETRPAGSGVDGSVTSPISYVGA